MTSAPPTATLDAGRSSITNDILLIFAVALFVGLPWLGQELDWDSREVRHALIPAEMAERLDYLVPTLLGEPYIYKPPVGHILTAWLYNVCGGPSMFLGRLVSVLAGLVCALACYGFARCLYDRRTALLSAVMLLGIPGFANILRKSRPDMEFSMGIMLACWLVVWGMARREGWKRQVLFLSAGAAFGLANLSKGPYGIFYAIFPLAVVACAPLQRAELLRPRLWEWPAVALGFCVFPTAWTGAVCLRPGGRSYLEAVFGQYNPSAEHQRHPLWYLERIPILILPWTLFLPALIKRVLRTPETTPLENGAPVGSAEGAPRGGIGAGLGGLDTWLRRYRLSAWAPLLVALATLAALSAASGKRDHYLGPWYPFIILPLGAVAAGLWERPRLGKLVRVLLLLSVLSVPAWFGLIQPRVLLRNNPDYDFTVQVIDALPERAAVASYKVLYEELAWVGRCRRWRRNPEVLPCDGPEKVLSALERCAREDRPCYLVIRERDLAQGAASLAHVRLEKVLDVVFHETALDRKFFGKPDEDRRYFLFKLIPEEPALNIARWP